MANAHDDRASYTYNRESRKYAWMRAHERFARAAINHGWFTLSYSRIYPSPNYCNLG